MTDILITILPFIFMVHDRVLSFLTPRVKAVKMLIIIVAHASLFGIFFPEVRKDFGELSWNILIAILFLSPISAIIGAPLLRVAMVFRREAGILMAYLAIVHGVGYFLDPIYFDGAILPYLGPDFFAMEPRLLFGILGIVLTFPLLLTSNTLMQRKLGGRNWKRLHMLVYPMFVFVVVHRFFPVLLSNSRFFFGVAQAASLVGGYVVLKYAAWKKESFGAIRSRIAMIGAQYRDFRLRTTG